ncbi:MAG: asparagine synthase (glutamine-hydrolyzing) [Acidobacteriales bacterium]|nr:asparagine synthase (glutamine-hydrolyzing) [Terriglobales bacterium]
MCGICGVLNLDRRNPVDRVVVAAMNQRIVHRGPDEDGYFVEGPVGLGMRRLSIIDVAGGHQPITNEDQSVFLIFNGEIYNHKKVREGLIARGHRYRTQSDTETVVHGYEEYGVDIVQHLQGMFAFAIWDARRKSLLIARDRLGIKPMYYLTTPQALVFGSEIKAILAYPGVTAGLDRDVLSEYLAFGYIAGEQTLFKGVRKLQPGHTMEIAESGEITIRQYWDLPPYAPEDHPQKHFVETFRQKLEETVVSHLMSDVPLGVFLSGGLDSSAVAALTARHHDGPVKTFSVGYDEEKYSELPYARQVAKHIGSDHYEIRISESDFFDALPKLIWHEDTPLMGPASVPLYFVAKLAREQVKVVLSGEGSDETLAGYSRYPWTIWNKRFDAVYGVLPLGMRSLIRRQIADGPWFSAGLKRKLLHTFLGRDGDFWESLYFDNFFSAFSEKEQSGLLAPGFTPAPGSAYKDELAFLGSRSGDMLSRLLYTDIKTYLVELLMKQDQMSMAASVESRVPFLDHLLLEFAMTIPSKYKTRGLTGKWILKEAVRDLLPESIIHRTKLGFPTPFEGWLAAGRLGQIESLMFEARSRQRGIFQEDALRVLFADHKSGRRNNYDRIWRVFTFELWCRVFLDGDKDLAPHIAGRAGSTGLSVPVHR